MRYKSVIAAWWCAALCSCTQTELPQSTHSITAGYGTSYSLHVALPAGYDSRRADGYPLLLYTDVSYMQPIVEKSLKRAGVEDRVIAVGIGYTKTNKRTEDLTPTAASLPRAGNAAAFASFIEGLLIPYLRQNYAVSGSGDALTFCGHSLGGLFGTYLFLNKQGLFRNYILVSPSLMWDEQAIFEEEKQLRPENQGASGKIFLATGSLESGGFHTTRQHLIRILKQYYPAVVPEEMVYRNKDHSGVVAPAVAEGLAFIFNR